MRYQTLSMAIAAAIDAFAAANGISRAQVAKGFSVAPAATQRMYDEIAQSSELLQKINMQGKEEMVGEVIGLASGLVGSTTNTAQQGKERQPRSIHSLSGRKFTLQKTNFDVLLRYEEIDGWAHVAKDFPARINKKIAESIAVSLITIGMCGTSRAENSDFGSNPLLQDVAKGWLQKMRDENPTRVMGKTSERQHPCRSIGVSEPRMGTDSGSLKTCGNPHLRFPRG